MASTAPDDARKMPGLLQPDLVITFYGSIPHEAQRLSLNLSSTQKLFAGDIAFHFNVHFDEGGIVVRNSYEKGKWMHPESDGPPSYLQKGSRFNCTIRSFKDKFQLDFNGQYFCDFIHRIPQDGMKWVVARGDVELYDVKFCYTV